MASGKPGSIARAITGSTARRRRTCIIEATNAHALGTNCAWRSAAMLVRSERRERCTVRQRPACSPIFFAHSGGGPCALRCARKYPNPPSPSTIAAYPPTMPVISTTIRPEPPNMTASSAQSTPSVSISSSSSVNRIRSEPAAGTPASASTRKRAGSAPDRDGVIDAPKSPPRQTRSAAPNGKGMRNAAALHWIFTERVRISATTAPSAIDVGGQGKYRRRSALRRIRTTGCRATSRSSPRTRGRREPSGVYSIDSLVRGETRAIASASSTLSQDTSGRRRSANRAGRRGCATW